MGITHDIQQRLIAIERTMMYNGEAVKASEYVSEGIQPPQTPLFVNHPVGSAKVEEGSGFYFITRTWELKLYGRKEGDGGRAENEFRMYDLSDLVYALFLTKRRLQLGDNGVDGIVMAQLTGDNGTEIEPYPIGDKQSMDFYVITFNMDITYRIKC